MIKIKYKALFTIDFPHTFYKSGMCNEIAVVPSADCRALIKSLGLRFLPSEFGAALYGKVNGSDVTNNPLPENTKFSFLLKLKNNSFENFTKLNLLKPAGSHYYFSNLKRNLSSGRPLLVANTTGKIVSDDDLLPFVCNSFSFADTGAAASKLGRLSFTDSGEVLEQTLKNSNNSFNFSFDLNRASNGRAVFSVNGVNKSSFLSVAAQEISETFGVIEIFSNIGLPTANQFQRTNYSIDTKNYSIPFVTRSTKWRFIVTKHFNQAITGVSASKTNGTIISFTTTPGASTDKFIITSNATLPLKEESIAGIKLTDQSNKVLVASLPNPPFNLIKTEGSNTFSDVLITI